MAPDDERWRRFEEALRYMHEHPAVPLEQNETRDAAFFEGWRVAVSHVWFQFELASRAAGFAESETVMGPIVSRACGYKDGPR